MPLVLIIIGLLMIVTGARNTYADFAAELKSDFTGQGNFLYWVAAIGAIGGIGYIKPLRPFSRAFLALILIAMLVRNGGIFDQVTQALAQGPISPTPGAAPGAASTSDANSASVTPATAAAGNPVVNAAIPGMATISNALAGKTFLGVTFKP